MTSHISCLTHVSADATQPALFLTAKNGQKYLIGRYGEGVQRAFTEKKFRSSKLTAVFVTGDVSWASVSGLPGLLLSMLDRSVPMSALYAGSGTPMYKLIQTVRSWRFFNFHQPLALECKSNKFEDDNLEVSPVTLGGTSTSFIISMKPTRGRFLVEKAIKLGVPKGKSFGLLSSGFPVTLENGNTVNPSDVMAPPPIPPHFTILDLPSNEHVLDASSKLPQLLSPQRKRLNLDEPVQSELRACYLFLGEEVDIRSQIFTDFIAQLRLFAPPNVILSHPLLSPNFTTLHSFCEFQKKLRTEFPNHFFPFYESSALETTNVGVPLLPDHSLSLDPRDSNAKQPTTQEPEPEPELTQLSKEEGSKQSGKLKCVNRTELSEPQVITLGTGASAPSKYRNVISTLVRHREGSVLFDAGEATSNTMTRMFGLEQKKLILNELLVVYISHMHADHHLGLLQLLKETIQVRTGEKLFVAAPQRYISFCKHWLRPAEYQKFVFVDLETTCISINPQTNAPFGSPKTLGKLKLSTVHAIHCARSYSVSIEFSDFKASYSGDTRPNPEFAFRNGIDSDLLIHEATHETALQEEAIEKNHSTISEALEVASKMRAKSVVLTHISQRYPRLPSISETEVNACFAFDTMVFSLSDVKNLQQMVPRMGEILEEAETLDNPAPESM